MNADIKNAMIAGFNKAFFYFNNYNSVPYTRHVLTFDTDKGDYVDTERTDFVPEVLVKAETSCNQHLISKWFNYVNGNTNGTEALFKLYGELGNTNRIAILGWIADNYDDEQHLF